MLRIAGKFEMKLLQGNFVENREIFRPQKEIPHFVSGSTGPTNVPLRPAYFKTARHAGHITLSTDVNRKYLNVHTYQGAIFGYQFMLRVITKGTVRAVRGN